MPKYRTPDGLEEHACIDRAVLDLMVDLERQRPWAEEEIACTISIPGDVRDSLRRLRSSRLIHRWNDLAWASHPVLRFHEINHANGEENPGEAGSAIGTEQSLKVCSCAAPMAKGRSFGQVSLSHRSS